MILDDIGELVGESVQPVFRKICTLAIQLCHSIQD